MGSNHRPSGYEPDELPLLYSAIHISCNLLPLLPFGSTERIPLVNCDRPFRLLRLLSFRFPALAELYLHSLERYSAPPDIGYFGNRVQRYGFILIYANFRRIFVVL